MVQMNKSLTNIPQISDMNCWCIPIENCDYRSIITDLQKKLKFLFYVIKLVVFDGVFNNNNSFVFLVSLILKTLKYSHFNQIEMDISSVNSP